VIVREVYLHECDFTKPTDGPVEKTYLAQMRKRMASLHREIHERAKAAKEAK
jgi:hypothetical protein